MLNHNAEACVSGVLGYSELCMPNEMCLLQTFELRYPCPSRQPEVAQFVRTNELIPMYDLNVSRPFFCWFASFGS